MSPRFLRDKSQARVALLYAQEMVQLIPKRLILESFLSFQHCVNKSLYRIDSEADRYRR
jgi:hypothetical protein